MCTLTRYISHIILDIDMLIIFPSTAEDLTQEEHLDNEFLWNLKLLSEVRM